MGFSSEEVVVSNSQNHDILIIISLLIIPFLASIFYLYSHLGTRVSGQKSNLPPSPPRLPLIGNLHQLGRVPHRSLKTLAEKHGPVLSLKLGQVTALVVSSPEILREIVSSHDAIFSSRPRSLASDLLLYEGQGIGFAPYDEHWRKARKLCVANLLSVARVKSFQAVREREVAVAVEKVRRACVDGKAVNLSRVLIESSNNIVSRCILGKSFREEDGSASRIEELSKKVSVQIMSLCVGDFFPWLGWVDVARGLVSRLRSTSKEFQVFLDRIIEEHKASSADDQDFVHILLKSQRDSTSDFELTPTKIKAIIQDMFTGGMDTTSAVTEWLMVELLRNPTTMKKAQDEVRKIGAEKKKIDINDMHRMTYLKYAVKETLRLHPPAPLLVPRETTATAKIGGYEIPAKTRVFVNAWAIMSDPSLWNDPEEFIPERFDKNSPDYIDSDHDLRYIPFGFGRRNCPGSSFATFDIEYAVANMLYWFDWKYSEENGLVENMDMSEVNGITVHKRIPLLVVPTQFIP